jgi:DNA polymerase-3 subunit gamma/tau
LAPNPRLGFEMTALRMLAFQPGTTKIEQPISATKPVQSQTPTQATSTISQPKPQTPQRKSQHLEAISKTLGQATTKKKLNSNEPRPAATNANTRIEIAAPQPVNQDQSPATFSLPETNDDWECLIDKLSLNGVPLQLAKNCAFVTCKDEQLELALAETHQQFYNKQREEILQQAIDASTGKKLRVMISIKDKVSDTPALREQQRARERQASAEHAIYNDGVVKAIVETFDGRISPKSIQPVD